MTVTFTTIMGGMGRIAIGADGKPAYVAHPTPIVLEFRVPGLTYSTSTSPRLGPAILTFSVPGLIGTMGPAVLAFNVPGVTRS